MDSYGSNQAALMGLFLRVLACLCVRMHFDAHPEAWHLKCYCIIHMQIIKFGICWIQYEQSISVFWVYLISCIWGYFLHSQCMNLHIENSILFSFPPHPIPFLSHPVGDYKMLGLTVRCFTLLKTFAF